MKELNLEVGQKLWSIQLGECEVESLNNENPRAHFPVKLLSKSGAYRFYTKELKYKTIDAHPSVFASNPFANIEVKINSFESNPFEPNLVQETKDGWIEPKENKAELINALVNLINSDMSEVLDTIAEIKLQKLLESL